MVGVAGLLALAGFATDNERATEIVGGRDGAYGACNGPPTCKFVGLDVGVGGGGNFTPPPAAPPVFVFPPAVPVVGGAEGAEEGDADAGMNALLSVLLAAAFSIALFSRSL